MIDSRENRIFRKIVKSLVKSMQTESDYERAIQLSATDLGVKTSELKGYLLLTTLKAFEELLEE
jgi:hypothetical protein